MTRFFTQQNDCVIHPSYCEYQLFIFVANIPLYGCTMAYPSPTEGYLFLAFVTMNVVAINIHAQVTFKHKFLFL